MLGLKWATNSLQPEGNASSSVEPPAPGGRSWWRRSSRGDVGAGCKTQS